jgi:serine/threonine protein kinase
MTQGLELRGAVLGKGYRLGRALDTQDGSAYEATHERLPGRFIIRLFPPESLSHPESSSRIQRGARVASLLRDPHAVQVLDFNVSGEMPAFVVIERVLGRSLAAAMTEDGLLSLSRVGHLVESVAAALAAGHQIGLVHGDVRPAHVMLPTANHPAAKLSGFGWAKEFRAAALTPAPSGYLAPEQNFGKVLTLDERVDQFGLAALTYEMIAACLPFSEESADLNDARHAHRTPPAIADLVPGVPRELDEVLRRGLAFVPSERFSSVSELAARIRATIRPQTGAATAGTGAGAHSPRSEDDGGMGIVPGRTNNDLTQEAARARSSQLPEATHDDPDQAHGDHTPHDVNPRGADAAQEAAAPATTEDGGFAIEYDPDDAKLVLGGTSGAAPSDEAKTKVVRSPFLDELESDTGPSARPAATTTPRRGIPTGRPATSPGPQIPLDSTRLDAREVDLAEVLRGVWSGIVHHGKWKLVAIGALGLLAIVGPITWLARRSNHSQLGVAVQAAATAPPAPPTAPTLPAPLAPLPPSGAPTEPPVDGPSGAPGSAAATSAPSGPPADQPATGGAAAPILAPPGQDKLAIASGDERASGTSIQMSRPVARHPPLKPPGSRSPGSPAAPPSMKAPSIAECSIRVYSRPWAEVWIDGKDTGRKTPVENLKVACGKRKLELKRPDKDIEQMEMLNVVPGKPSRGNYELE